MTETLFETTQTGKNNMHCVYCHRNKINGKRYIGQTCNNPERRWMNGNGYKANQHFFRAIQKYGWEGFDHNILIDALTKQEADIVEKTLIALYDCLDPKYGYNIDKGGSHGGYPHTEEAKHKMSIARMGNTYSAGKPNTRGYIWVNNGKEETLIPPEKTQEYTENGYVIGPLKTRYSEERAQKIGQSKIGNTYCKGRIRVNDDVVEKMIFPEQLQEYLDKGFVKGTIMTEERRQKMRTSLGKPAWNKGLHYKNNKSSEVNKDRRYMHKDGRNTTVKPEDIDKYLADGWVLGRITKKRKKE